MAKNSKKDKEDLKLTIPKKKLFQVVGIVAAIAVIIVAAGAFTGYFTFADSLQRGPEGKAINFINNYLMQPGMEVELEDSTFQDGVHVITLSMQGQMFDVYVTEDERYLFTEAIDMDDELMLQQMLGPEIEINPEIVGREVETQQEIEEKTMDFINEYMLLEPGINIEHVETSIESGLYNILFMIEGESIEVFVNKNGNYMFLGPIDMDMDMDAMMPEQPEVTEPVEYDLGEEIMYNEEGQLIVHYFYTETCPYCNQQSEILDELEASYANEIEIVSYDLAERENSQIAQEMAAMHGVQAGGVPITFTGGEAFMGLTSLEVLEGQIVNCIETVC